MSQNSPTLLPSRETGASPSCLRGDEYHFAQIDINRIKISGRYFCLK